MVDAIERNLDVARAKVERAELSMDLLVDENKIGDVFSRGREIDETLVDSVA